MKFSLKAPSDVIIEKTTFVVPNHLFCEPNKAAIYGILNLVNGKIYIGSAVEVLNRLRTHKSRLNLNKHPSKHLQGAWNEYGAFAFEFVILEYCDKKDLLEREAYWFSLTDCCNPECGYNKRKIPNSNLGLLFGPATEARKLKLKKIHTGRIISEETREKIKNTLTGFKHSKETRDKVSAAGIGRIFSKERNEKIGKANSKPNKWPHEKKYSCNCRECLDKKRLIRLGVYHEV